MRSSTRARLLTSTEDLLDCVSLATQIRSDAIICMTEAGEQITEGVVRGMVRRGLDQGVVRTLLTVALRL